MSLIVKVRYTSCGCSHSVRLRSNQSNSSRLITNNKLLSNVHDLPELITRHQLHMDCHNSIIQCAAVLHTFARRSCLRHDVTVSRLSKESIEHGTKVTLRSQISFLRFSENNCKDFV